VLAECKGRSEPKLAVANEVKPDLERVDVSVEVVWEVLVDVGSINASALELAAERE